MRNRRIVRIRPGGSRIVFEPLWPTIRGSAGSIGKSFGRLQNRMFGPSAQAVRP